MDVPPTLPQFFFCFFHRLDYHFAFAEHPHEFVDHGIAPTYVRSQ